MKEINDFIFILECFRFIEDQLVKQYLLLKLVKLTSYIIIYWYIDQELLQYALLPNNEMTDYMCM